MADEGKVRPKPGLIHGETCESPGSVIGPVGPHPEGRFLDGFGMAIAETSVEAIAVTFGNMAHGRVLLVWAAVQKGRTETSVVPSVGLLDTPDFEDVGAAVADRASSFLLCATGSG